MMMPQSSGQSEDTAVPGSSQSQAISCTSTVLLPHCPPSLPSAICENNSYPLLQVIQRLKHKAMLEPRGHAWAIAVHCTALHAHAAPCPCPCTPLPRSPSLSFSSSRLMGAEAGKGHSACNPAWHLCLGRGPIVTATAAALSCCGGSGAAAALPCTGTLLSSSRG